VRHVRRVTRLLVVAAAVVAVVAPPAQAKVGDLYALRYGAQSNLLMPYDPVRLAVSGPGIRLGRFGHAWSVSADRSQLVVAAGVRRPGEATAVRLVDLRVGRVEGTYVLADEFRRVSATAWVRGRVLVVVAGERSTTVYSFDPHRRVPVGKVDLPAKLVGGERTASALLLLLAPAEGIGAATVAVIDGVARARSVVVDRIRVGTAKAAAGSGPGMTMRRPGIAISPSGERLYLFGAGEPTAIVNLNTRTVQYVPLRQTSALTKESAGAVRAAAALPDGRVVVWGHNYGSSKPVGVTLFDPRNSSTRLLSPAASWVQVEAGLIFTRGRGGVGLRILRPSGGSVDLFRTGSPAAVRVVGPHALVTFFGSGRKAAVVELSTHRIVGHTVPAHLLTGTGQAIIG